ncbi:hypothetical protein [Paraflavitalea pollutisoli]|uniref:hypothetical protein n=1 Tax=Paraflavitalea pollutisoli TaxID=3034143 RepID=UPI0023ED7CE5|nr:hypothetical protein [Paraflavitalea sp. H1-2-19X]
MKRTSFLLGLITRPALHLHYRLFRQVPSLPQSGSIFYCFSYSTQDKTTGHDLTLRTFVMPPPTPGNSHFLTKTPAYTE